MRSSRFVYELKHDGFRALAYIRPGHCQLVSRRGNVYKSFGSLSAALGKLDYEAVLDGEIVVLDAAGRSQFYELLRRRGEPVFYAFDCLSLDGRDLRPLPLIQRKKKLNDWICRRRPRARMEQPQERLWAVDAC